mgnify:CR=1 FL=1
MKLFFTKCPSEDCDVVESLSIILHLWCAQTMANHNRKALHLRSKLDVMQNKVKTIFVHMSLLIQHPSNVHSIITLCTGQTIHDHNTLQSPNCCRNSRVLIQMQHTRVALMGTHLGTTHEPELSTLVVSITLSEGIKGNIKPQMSWHHALTVHNLFTSNLKAT